MSEIDDPIHQQFSDEELAAIVAEAARADRVVAAHCHGKPGIMAALRAGVRTIEHGTWLDEEAADLMRRSGAVLVPTRFVVETLQEMTESLPPYVRTKAVAIADRHLEAMRIAVAAGVTLAMGTDVFLPGGYGRNSDEIRLLVDAGLSPLQAVEAATANGPSTLGPQAPRSGVLEAGIRRRRHRLRCRPPVRLGVWGDPDRVTHVWKSGVTVKSPYRPEFLSCRDDTPVPKVLGHGPPSDEPWRTTCRGDTTRFGAPGPSTLSGWTPPPPG